MNLKRWFLIVSHRVIFFTKLDTILLVASIERNKWLFNWDFCLATIKHLVAVLFTIFLDKEVIYKIFIIFLIGILRLSSFSFSLNIRMIKCIEILRDIIGVKQNTILNNYIVEVLLNAYFLWLVKFINLTYLVALPTNMLIFFWFTVKLDEIRYNFNE